MTTGTRLILIGANAEATNGLTNAAAIGPNSLVEASNSLILGGFTGNGNGGANTNVGIGTTTPDNRLEIVRGAQGSNISGLRLTSLLGSTPASPTGGVLSIDESGDVILVRDSAGGDAGGVGNYCSEPQDTLSGHYEIPLNDYNYYFTGSEVYANSGFNTNGVAIGIPCGNDLSAKLHVIQDQVNSIDSNPFSITGAFENTDTSAFIGYGVVGISRGDKLNMNIGGHFLRSMDKKITSLFGDSVEEQGVTIITVDDLKLRMRISIMESMHWQTVAL